MWIKLLNRFVHRTKELFAPKHSRFSAETLQHSIYTYSYMYKKTNSCQTKTMDKWNFKARYILIVLLVPCITSCCNKKNIYISITQPGTLCVNERLETKTHPAQFYLCGNNCYPCHQVTNRWSGIVTHRYRNKHFKSVNNFKEKVHAKTVKKS